MAVKGNLLNFLAQSFFTDVINSFNLQSESEDCFTQGLHLSLGY